MHSSGVPLTDDTTPGDVMDVDHTIAGHLPDRAVEAGASVMNKEEERAAARESTTAFAGQSGALTKKSVLNASCRLGDCLVQAGTCSV